MEVDIKVGTNPFRGGYCVKLEWVDCCSGKSMRKFYDFSSREAAQSAVRKARRTCPPGCHGIVGAIARMSDCSLDSDTQMRLGMDYQDVDQNW